MDKKKFAFFFLVLLALIFGFGIFCIVYQARGAINPQVQAGVSDSERACAIQICNVSEKKIVFSIFKEETLIQKQEVDPEFCAFMIDEKNTPPLLMLGPQDYTVEFRGENGEVMTGSPRCYERNGRKMFTVGGN